MLFVGTKKQAQESIRDEAPACGMHYVNARWLGGMLTNFRTIRGRIDRLAQLQSDEGGRHLRACCPRRKSCQAPGLEMAKLEKYLGGVTEHEDAAQAPCSWWTPARSASPSAEARKLNIPIVAIVDTNCDPDEIDYVIPGNDDAIRAVKLISSVMANAIQEGKQGQDEAPR